MEKWKEILQNSITDGAALKAVLSLTDEEVQGIQSITDVYPMCVNPYYLSLIDPKDPNDPIRRMAVPNPVEFTRDGSADTSGEAENTVMKGLQHKYHQTALILSTNSCAMYCRFCFRKRMVGKECHVETADDLNAMASYIAAHPEIDNILVSGGDAFLNSNEEIGRYLEIFSNLPQLHYIRFGTRVPTVLPQRITEDEGLSEVLKKYRDRIQIIIVTHFNHPRELTEEATHSLRILKESGCVIRNQAVLLKGVNDSEETLATLMNALVSVGVIPYYLFQCRPTAGVKNQFQVPITRGAELVDRARMQMDGQAKSFRYIMSHPTGKIEILGNTEQGVLFKYHQAKNDINQGKIMAKKLGAEVCWLYDNLEVSRKDDWREYES